MSKSNLKVFISYSPADDDLVASVKSIIKDISRTSWDDREIIKWGEDWQDRLERSLSEAKIYILMITPTSLKSPWANFEMGVAASRSAQSRDVKIIPILLGGVSWEELPPPIRTWQGINANSMGKEELAAAIKSRLENEFNKEQGYKS